MWKSDTCHADSSVTNVLSCARAISSAFANPIGKGDAEVHPASDDGPGPFSMLRNCLPPTKKVRLSIAGRFPTRGPIPIFGNDLGGRVGGGVWAIASTARQTRLTSTRNLFASIISPRDFVRFNVDGQRCAAQDSRQHPGRE